MSYTLYSAGVEKRNFDVRIVDEASSEFALVLRFLVPKKGLEPPHPCGYMDLNHARLPIPPLRHGWMREELAVQEQDDCTGGKREFAIGGSRFAFRSSPEGVRSHSPIEQPATKSKKGRANSEKRPLSTCCGVGLGGALCAVFLQLVVQRLEADA